MGVDGVETGVAGRSGSWKTLSTGSRIGVAALRASERTADTDGIAKTSGPCARLKFHANDVEAVGW